MISPVKIIFLIIFLQVSFASFAQIPQKPNADTVKEFEIIRGPSMRSLYVDSITTLQTIAGGAVVKQGTTIFTADSMVINPNTHIVEAFNNVHINQNDSVQTYSQYLRYVGTEKTAYLTKDVRLYDKKGTLFTQSLDYNLGTGIGNYHNGGKVINGKTTITSDDGTYFADTKDIYFKNNVIETDGKNHTTTDSLLYNMVTQNSNLYGNTHIKNKDVDIYTKQGTYDFKTGNAIFTTRTSVKDSSGVVYVANNMALDNNSGNAQLEGNAIVKDSAGGYIVFANQIFLNKKNKSFLATRKPVLIIKQSSDSIYVAADTIFSGFTSKVSSPDFILKKDSIIGDTSQNKNVIDTSTTVDSLQKKLKPALKNERDSSYYLAHVIDSLNEKSAEPKKIQVKKDSIITVTDSLKLLKIPADSSHTKALPVIIQRTDSAKPIDSVQQHQVIAIDTLKHGNLLLDSSRKHTTPSNAERVKAIRESLLKADSTKPGDTTQHQIQSVKDLSKNFNSHVDSLKIKYQDVEQQKVSLLRDSVKPVDSVPSNPFLTDTLEHDLTKIPLRNDHADSLFALHMIHRDSVEAPDTSRYFLAFHHVRIFSDSLQSVCDSLFFSAKDSIFRLYYDPIIWGGHSQITGDTIFLYTKNKKADRLYAFEQSMIVNKTTQGFYNQISGKTINGYFHDGAIDYMRVRGSQAESIYYAQDEDSAYLGMNRATGDVIDLYFKNNDLIKVLYVNDIAGKFYPMRQIPQDQKFLKNFIWLENKRPKNKLELFE